MPVSMEAPVKKSSSYRYFWVVLLAFLVACGQQTATLPTETAIPTAVSPTAVSTATFLPVIVVPSPLPTEPTIPVITPDSIQVERWEEYQTALAKSFLPRLLPEEVACEWEILGQSEQEVYVAAICMGTTSPGTLEDPAVIYIGIDGSVQSVQIPRGGTHYASDIRQMFPPDVQEKYFGKLIHSQELLDHLNWRREHPKEPPLIVLSATPAP